MIRTTKTASPFIAMFVLIACNFSTTLSTPTSPPTQPPVIEPSPTTIPSNTPAPSKTPVPTNTSIPPTPTVTLTPTPSVLFRDDFENVLADGWSWVRENFYYWNLTEAPGYLRMITFPGGLSGSGDPPTNNILLREAPQGNFVIETSMKFTPTSNYQFAGLIIYQSDTTFLQFGRAFCTPSANCIGNGIYFDNVENGNMRDSNFTTSVNNANFGYLKIKREGDTYTGYFSEDRQQWMTIGQHQSMITPLRVGLVAHQAYESRETADFDYFAITAIP